MPVIRPPPHPPEHISPLPRAQIGRRYNAGSVIQFSRDNEVARKAWDIIELMSGMLAVRQAEYGDTPEGRLAFAKNELNVQLADRTAGRLLEFMAYGYARLKTIEFVGDAPVVNNVKNVVQFRLNTHAPAGAVAAAAGNGHDAGTAGAGGDAQRDDLRVQPPVDVPETNGGDL